MTICIECGSDYDIIRKKRLREVDRRKTQRRILVSRRSNPGRRVRGRDSYYEVYDGLYQGRRDGYRGRRGTEAFILMRTEASSYY